jgi:hypothetical protein
MVWITFFDGNDLIGVFRNKWKLVEMENEIQFYKNKIDQVAIEQSRLKGDKRALEVFAREKYLMKKQDEDIFLIHQEPDKSMFDRLMSK